MIKKRDNKIKRSIIGLILIGLMVSLTACNQEAPFESTSADETASALSKRGKTTISEAYPQANALTVHKFAHGKAYKGGTMSLPNGSRFTISNRSLTPPENHQKDAPVTITMTCERDSINSELLFTYGPHGSQFSPPAQLTLSWKDLNIEIPTLYYVDENGDYIEQQPDYIDVNGKWLMITVPHFSRYALAWAR